jgi:hypothetical protein
VFDVSTPSAPTEVGFHNLGEQVHRVEVANGYLYLTTESSLRIFDLSVPASPVEVGFCSVGGAGDLTVSGGYAFLGTGFELHIIDVGTPSLPFEVGACVAPGEVGYIAVSGDYALVTCHSVPLFGVPGLLMLDLSDPTKPDKLWFEEGFTWGVDMVGEYAYVMGEDGLRVLDVSDPSSPILAGQCPDVSGGALEVSGGYAYISSGGVRVVDVSTPFAPVEVGFNQVPGGCDRDITVVDGFVYHAICSSGFAVYDECSMFHDGFESGDTSAWSSTVP